MATEVQCVPMCLYVMFVANKNSMCIEKSVRIGFLESTTVTQQLHSEVQTVQVMT